MRSAIFNEASLSRSRLSGSSKSEILEENKKLRDENDKFKENEQLKDAQIAELMR